MECSEVSAGRFLVEWFPWRRSLSFKWLPFFILCACNMPCPQPRCWQSIRGLLRSTSPCVSMYGCPVGGATDGCGVIWRVRKKGMSGKLSRGVESWTESLQGGVGTAPKEGRLFQAAKTSQKALRSCSKNEFGNSYWKASFCLHLQYSNLKTLNALLWKGLLWKLILASENRITWK